MTTQQTSGGIKVNRVELQDITPPASVSEAMEKQMQAERNKRAAILTSEGDKQSAILQSEGEKEAAINRAEAKKQQQILIAEGEAEARIRKAEAEAVAIQEDERKLLGRVPTQRTISLLRSIFRCFLNWLRTTIRRLFTYHSRQAI